MWKNTTFGSYQSGQEQNLAIPSLSKVQSEKIIYLAHEFYNHSAIEIWGPSIMDTLYESIDFLVHTKLIREKGFLEDVLSNIQLLLNNLNMMVSTGVKRFPGSSEVGGKIQVYNNKLRLGGQILYYESNNEVRSMLIHKSPHFIVTKQKAFGQYLKTQLHNTISYSSRLSDDSIQERIKYFDKIQSFFDAFKDRIYKVFEYANLD